MIARWLGPVLGITGFALEGAGVAGEFPWAVLGAAVWMLIWWIGEAAPLAVTSLLPIVLFPLTEVQSVAQVTAQYGSKYVFLFMGGFLIAIALEKWGLHKRVALGILRRVGKSPRHIIAGFMLATWALSMWISNTATTLMMLPIALSVIGVVEARGGGNSKFALALLLGTAYAANTGGMATLVGTPPNMAMAGILELEFGVVIPFLEWMVLALPFSAFLGLFVYIMLTRILYQIPSTPLEIDGIWDAPKPWKRAERAVAWVFVATAISWVVRRFIVEWTAWPIDDTMIAMTAGIALFLIPGDKDRTLLEWEDTRRLPWNILLLFGGGLALAGCLSEAGILDELIALLGNAELLPFIAVTAMLVFAGLMLTEVMSNLALTVVLVPVVAALALNLEYSVLVFAVPVTLASSCAFMLPMATPPNAIIFGANRIRMIDMVRTGWWLNLGAVLFTIALAEWILPVWMAWL